MRFFQLLILIALVGFLVGWLGAPLRLRHCNARQTHNVETQKPTEHTPPSMSSPEGIEIEQGNVVSDTSVEIHANQHLAETDPVEDPINAKPLPDILKISASPQSVVVILTQWKQNTLKQLLPAILRQTIRIDDIIVFQNEAHVNLTDVLRSYPRVCGSPSPLCTNSVEGDSRLGWIVHARRCHMQAHSSLRISCAAALLLSRALYVMDFEFRWEPSFREMACEMNSTKMYFVALRSSTCTTLTRTPSTLAASSCLYT